MNEKTREKSTTKLNRCPFCHASVSPENDDWVVCSQCLARQHQECWQDNQSCASCGCQSHLHSREAGPNSTHGLGTPLNNQQRHGEVFALFDREEKKSQWFNQILFNPITAGLYGLFSSESALHYHRRANREQHFTGEETETNFDSSLEKRFKKARHQAFKKDTLLAGARTILASLAQLIFIIPCIVSLADWIDRGRFDEMYILQLLFGGVLVIHLHLFRETVRNHEFQQAQAQFIRDDVSPYAISAWLKKTRASWNARRFVDILVSGLVLIPGLALLLLLTTNFRELGALHTHEDNEKDIDRLCRDSRTDKEATSKPAAS